MTSSTDTGNAIAATIDAYISSFDAGRGDNPVSTAQKITSTFLEAAKTGEELPEPWAIYQSIVSRIRTTTHDSLTQDNLVKLVGAIKETRPEPKEDYWSSLYPLGLYMRELWNGDYPATEWASLNAFVARLTVANVLDFQLFGIWAMRSALENGPAEGELSNDVLNQQIPAAAVWIFYAGSKLWDLSTKEANAGETAARGGQKWQGTWGYNQPRWVFWKMRFEGFAGRKDLRQDTTTMAKKALEGMSKVDETVTN
ncbi:hypothetical protein D9758_000904 [Tetrapyrgos nigripes]|uniref:Uncharacterized protein n=1 Tax=Tetrapyrgos nigripes TaxID=182062 RepID=A0A8H5LXG2_9AGAR|nr:hypothetical protein D9758_000904 [Tetrapyrgos nigripes]